MAENTDVERTRPEYDSSEWWYCYFIGYTIATMLTGEIYAVREGE